jgi:hypothetical protein
MPSLLYDVDVHHTWTSEHELLQFAPASTREHLRLAGTAVPALHYSRAGGTIFRLDAEPDSGAAPGSDYELMREQLLDANQTARVLLTFNIGREEAFHNPAIAPVLCRAANDWSMEQWLQRDDRLQGALMVPMSLPGEAVKEIERLGDHHQIAGVLAIGNAFNLPFGHPIYRPIYRAAADRDLPIVFHVASDTTSKAGMCAGGVPTTKPEYYTLLEQPAMTHLGSFIVGGVFEEIPNLRLLFNEFGFAWLPWVLWSLDARYAALQRESRRMRPGERLRSRPHLDVDAAVRPPAPGSARRAAVSLRRSRGQSLLRERLSPLGL